MKKFLYMPIVMLVCATAYGHDWRTPLMWDWALNTANPKLTELQSDISALEDVDAVVATRVDDLNLDLSNIAYKSNQQSDITASQYEDLSQTLSQLCASIYLGDEPAFCRKTVFVTSQDYSGDLREPGNNSATAGLEGGDAKCQQAADAAGLNGVYKAWLSGYINSVIHDPSTRFTHASTPYRDVNGEHLWDNWANIALQFEAPDAPLNTDEYGNQKNDEVWTGTFADGQAAAFHCENWTSAASPASALFGLSNSVDIVQWTDYNYHLCYEQKALYCFQQ